MSPFAVKACAVAADTFVYYARVITFDFANNGRGLSIFSKINVTHS